MCVYFKSFPLKSRHFRRNASCSYKCRISLRKKKETQFLRRRRAGTCENQILYPESDDNLGNFFFRGCGKEFNLTLTALPSPTFIVVVVVFYVCFFPKMFLSFEWRRLTAASFITLCVRTRFYICVILKKVVCKKTILWREKLSLEWCVYVDRYRGKGRVTLNKKNLSSFCCIACCSMFVGTVLSKLLRT